MDAAYGKADFALIRRFTAVALFLILFTFGFSWLLRFYSRRFENFTGSAQWIWASHQISRNEPVVFFAVRDFDLPEPRHFTHLKVFADPEYTLYFNGQLIASRAAGEQPHLDVYDVTPLAHTGRNRIVVAVRSTNGVGGLIGGVDIANEVVNIMVTDRQWKIFRTWNDALPLHDVGSPRPPMVLGVPPLGRWDFLSPKNAGFDALPQKVLDAKAAIDFRATVPTVKIAEGVAVATQRPVRAIAYDFGFTSGRIRFTLLGESPVPPVITYRLANVPDEFGVVEARIRSTAFAAGERSVTEPEPHRFRYVIVFGGRARAQVVQ